MEEISCIFCNVSTALPVIKESGFQGKKCNECSLIYISPRPSIDEVLDLYGHSDAHISPYSHITESYFKYLHSRHTLSIIKKYKKSGKILEVGAGGGFFLAQARKEGFDPFALELNPIQADFITHSHAIPCEKKQLSSTSFGTTTFDIIYHNDVISHFHDPQEAFATIYAKLNEGGILIFETGNLGDVDRSYYRLFDSFQYPDHLFFFTEKNLRQLLKQNHFKFKAIYRYSIVAHLKILKLIASLTKKPAMPAKELPTTKKRISFINKLLKKMYHACLYTIRYRLGTILPKKNRPQTMIIVAQKD